MNFINGAQGRNRTGTVFLPRDFLTNYSFHYCLLEYLSWDICGLDFIFTVL